jgi:hypothetical protein
MLPSAKAAPARAPPEARLTCADIKAAATLMSHIRRHVTGNSESPMKPPSRHVCCCCSHLFFVRAFPSQAHGRHCVTPGRILRPAPGQNTYVLFRGPRQTTAHRQHQMCSNLCHTAGPHGQLRIPQQPGPCAWQDPHFHGCRGEGHGHLQRRRPWKQTALQGASFRSKRQCASRQRVNVA